MAKSATSLGSSLPHLPELCALPTSEESVWGMISRGDIEEWSWRASRKISPERRYLSQLGGHFDNVASIPWTYRLGDFDISVVRIPQYPKPSLTCRWLGSDYDRLCYWLNRGGQVSSSGIKRKRPKVDYQSWVRSATARRAVNVGRHSKYPKDHMGRNRL
ncbi:hypothetical protein AC578_10764 [Pseudocercospora eumusae]|uniref:Uncharacterized protein n=1 Tax=Pseudocercospora eumusae TaxID=321146 RepID=A0A139GZR6_9PEZI|nr:hypothetical protein AC578_10764 [Pseudocercospora eumusae]